MSTNTDFQDILKEALELADFVIPPEEFMQQVEDEVTPKVKNDVYSAKEMSGMINNLNSGSIISKHTFHKVKNFMQYMKQNYSDSFKAPSEGMSDFMKKHKIDTRLRAEMVKEKLLLTEGFHVNSKYKWNRNKGLTDHIIYDCILKSRIRESEEKRSPKRIGLIHRDEMQTSVKAGLTVEQFLKSKSDHFKHVEESAIRAAYKRYQDKKQQPEVGVTTTAKIEQWTLPTKDMEINTSVLPENKPIRMNIEEEVLLAYFTYYEFSPTLISEVMGRNRQSIYGKQYQLRNKTGDLHAWAMDKMRNNKEVLKKLFTFPEEETTETEVKEKEVEEVAVETITEELPEKPEIVVEEKLDIQPKLQFEEKPGKPVDNPEINYYNSKDILDLIGKYEKKLAKSKKKIKKLDKENKMLRNLVKSSVL